MAVFFCMWIGTLFRCSVAQCRIPIHHSIIASSNSPYDMLQFGQLKTACASASDLKPELEHINKYYPSGNLPHHIIGLNGSHMTWMPLKSHQSAVLGYSRHTYICVTRLVCTRNYFSGCRLHSRDTSTKIQRQTMLTLCKNKWQSSWLWKFLAFVPE